MEKNRFVLCGAPVYTPNGILDDSAIVINQNKIEAILSVKEIKKNSDMHIFEFLPNHHILPGFIDLHVHGANNHDVMDANIDSLKTISETLAKEGTTSYLATTMTASLSELENVASHVCDYMKIQDTVQGAKVLGLHLEGPFISSANSGAQSKHHVLNPDVSWVKKLQEKINQIIKIVTLAPELENSGSFIEFLKKNHIIPSIGHTHATYEQTLAAIDAGCCYATHLFNAMRGLHHREPGTVGAILLSDVVAELIVDGVHLHPAIVELVLKIKGKDKLVLVTDAMRAKCMPDGIYQLGGQEVIVQDRIATLGNGTLAGSTLRMCDAFKQMLKFSKCVIEDVVQMTSENPAKILGIYNRKGSLEVGKDADIVILNKQHEVVITFCEGRKIHE